MITMNTIGVALLTGLLEYWSSQIGVQRPVAASIGPCGGLDTAVAAREESKPCTGGRCNLQAKGAASTREGCDRSPGKVTGGCGDCDSRRCGDGKSAEGDCGRAGCEDRCREGDECRGGCGDGASRSCCFACCESSRGCRGGCCPTGDRCCCSEVRRGCSDTSCAGAGDRRLRSGRWDCCAMADCRERCCGSACCAMEAVCRSCCEGASGNRGMNCRSPDRDCGPCAKSCEPCQPCCGEPRRERHGRREL